jgi:hypothetical protein
MSCVLGVVLVAIAACNEEDKTCEECSTLCKELAVCDLLPSPLGQDTDNCTQRCKRSCQTDAGKSLHDSINTCVDDHKIKSTKTASPPCVDGCRDLAQCLDQNVPNQEGVTGVGGLAVSLSIRAEEDTTVTSPDQGCYPKSAAMDPPSDEQCMDLGSYQLQLTVTDRAGATYFVEDQGCAFIKSAHVFAELAAGLANASIRIGGVVRLDMPMSGSGGAGSGGMGTGGADSDAGAIPAVEYRCGSVADAARVLVSAGEQALLNLSATIESLQPPPAPAQCEVGATACSNGLDDDLNGLADCDDPQCQTQPGCSASLQRTAPHVSDAGVAM